MSKQNALNFLKQLEEDSNFRAKVVEAAQNRADLRPQSIDFDQLGFNVQDMHEAMREFSPSLTAEQIREITGGVENLPKEEFERIALMHVYGVTAAV